VVGSGFNPTRTGKRVLKTWDKNPRKIVVDFVFKKFEESDFTKTNKIQLGGVQAVRKHPTGGRFFSEDSFGRYLFLVSF